MEKLFFSVIFFSLLGNAFAQPEYSEIKVEWDYSEESKTLDIVFSSLGAGISEDVDAAYVLTDFSANALVGEGALPAPLPQTISFSGIEQGSYTLVLNNFLTKKQSMIQINIGKPLQAVPAALCSEQKGFSCKENEVCSSTPLSASDGLCCSVQCKAKPPITVLPLVFGSIWVVGAVALILILVLYFLFRKKNAGGVWRG